MQTELDEELAFFEAHRQEWLHDHNEEFALIKGCELLGFYPTFEEGANSGMKRFGMQAMLVKQVLAKDPEHYWLGRFVR